MEVSSDREREVTPEVISGKWWVISDSRSKGG